MGNIPAREDLVLLFAFLVGFCLLFGAGISHFWFCFHCLIIYGTELDWTLAFSGFCLRRRWFTFCQLDGVWIGRWIS